MAEPISQVISEILDGDALTLSAAAKDVPAHRGEGRSTPSRLSRWGKSGYKRADGTVVKLETAKFGAQVLTSKAALKRFLVAINSAADGEAIVPPVGRTAALRRSAGEAAAKRLTKAGA